MGRVPGKLSDHDHQQCDDIFIMVPKLIQQRSGGVNSVMKTFEVEYETTLPPWRIGYEMIEAEDLTAVKEKFSRKHEAARILRYSNESSFLQRSNLGKR